MENASKALIISGSILVAIVLIAIGVKTFSSTSDTVDAQQTQLESSEVEIFNNKFYAYIGKNKSASEVKALANLIIATNASNPPDKIKLYIPKSLLNGASTLLNSEDANDITDAISKLKNDIQYQIRVNQVDTKTNRIKKIQVIKSTP